MKFMPNVIYLQDTDLQMGASGPELVVKNGMPSVLMVQGNHCHYCTEAKPAFNSLAQSEGVNVFSIQTDEETARNAAQMIMQTLGGRGVPFIVGAGRNGVFSTVYEGERSPEGFANFARQLA